MGYIGADDSGGFSQHSDGIIAPKRFQSRKYG